MKKTNAFLVISVYIDVIISALLIVFLRCLGLCMALLFNIFFWIIWYIVYLKKRITEFEELKKILKKKFTIYDSLEKTKIKIFYNNSSANIYKLLVGEGIDTSINFNICLSSGEINIFLSHENEYDDLKDIKIEDINSLKIKVDDIIKYKLYGQKHFVESIESNSNIGGAIVGGVLAGGVGAMIGGQRKISSSTKEIDDRVVKLYFKFKNKTTILDLSYSAYDWLTLLVPEKEIV